MAISSRKYNSTHFMMINIMDDATQIIGKEYMIKPKGSGNSTNSIAKYRTTLTVHDGHKKKKKGERENKTRFEYSKGNEKEKGKQKENNIRTAIMRMMNRIRDVVRLMEWREREMREKKR